VISKLSEEARCYRCCESCFEDFCCWDAEDQDECIRWSTELCKCDCGAVMYEMIWEKEEGIAEE